jgi:hypothetical protein
VGPEAKKVFTDAQEMLKMIIDLKLIQAHAVVGLYPANSTGDGINPFFFFGFWFLVFGFWFLVCLMVARY